MTSTQHVRVEGTSYQRGRQYGRQAAARIRLSIHVRTEVMYSAKARQAPRTGTQLPLECSAFACVPGPGQQDPVLIGQNWDWLLHSAQTLVVLEVRQDEGPDFVTVVDRKSTRLNSSHSSI